MFSVIFSSALFHLGSNNIAVAIVIIGWSTSLCRATVVRFQGNSANLKLSCPA